MLRWHLDTGGDVNFGSSSWLRGCEFLSIFAVLIFHLEGELIISPPEFLIALSSMEAQLSVSIC